MDPTNGSPTEPPAQPACLPPYWPLFAVAAVLPFVFATMVLDLVAPTPLQPEHFTDAFSNEAWASVGHLGDRLTYAGLAYVQFASGLLVVGFYVKRLARLDPARRKGALRLLGVSFLSAGAAVLPIRFFGGAAREVTYLNFRCLLQQVPITRDFTMPDPVVDSCLEGTTAMGIASAMPFWIGAIAVIFAVPVGAAAASFVTREPQNWEHELAERVRLLQQAFYALGVVLVANTVTLMLFFQIPAEIAVDEYRDGFLRYARGLTVFWGATMTLTLVSSFLPAALALRQCARQRFEAVQSGHDFGEWFAARVPTSARRQLANLATMLAPLLVGVLGSLLQPGFAGV